MSTPARDSALTEAASLLAAELAELGARETEEQLRALTAAKTEAA